MKPRAFVIMPFGKKPLDKVHALARSSDTPARIKEVDFDAVYTQLLEPALVQAGCEPARADSEIAAGDIRTDMFFELVTADVVVADISIANPNVFYELGVRHGVCPHGVLALHNSMLAARPFDVSVDRSFQYDWMLFLASNDTVEGIQHKRQDAIAQLADTIKRALQRDQQTTASPVYEHLPGLVPVNWDNIDTSRSRFFGQLNDDWLELVHQAQANGYPGTIQTMADDAPTLFHRNLILYEAIRALIDLCRYDAAERNLRKLIQHDPNNFNAQLKLGLVLSQQGKTEMAETQLRRILTQHEGEPHAGDLLGQVYRYLWRLGWKDSKEDRKQKAIISAGQAAQAIQSFIQAQEYDPRAYFAGFNALILFALVTDLFEREGKELPEIWRQFSSEKMTELAAVVQFCARNARDYAMKKGDFVDQFWATTTLSGLALIQHKSQVALAGIEEACSISKATFFQLKTFEDRLMLLEELDFKLEEFVRPALAKVREALAAKRQNHCSCQRVILWAGYALDKPSGENPSLDKSGMVKPPASISETAPRFPASSVPHVREQIVQALEDWKIKEGDLAICEGSTEGDILFAEECLSRNAQVRLMLLDTGDENTLWPFPSDDWAARFKRLRRNGAQEWFHTQHLGPFRAENMKGHQSLRRRHRNWIINTVRFEADSTSDNPLDWSLNAAPRLLGLFLWSGEGDDEDVESPAFFIKRVNEFDNYEGEVKIIHTPA